MDNTKFMRLAGLFNIVAGLLLFIWWFLMGTVLPISSVTDSLVPMINHNYWIPINILGFMGTVILAISFCLLFLAKYENFNTVGIIGFIVGEVGIIWYTSIQYYETFVWPVVAKVNPELLGISGLLVSGDKTILIALILSGLFLGLGYILIGINFIINNMFSKPVIWFFIIGALVFGNGIAIVVRTIGLLLLVIAHISIGRSLIVESKE